MKTKILIVDDDENIRAAVKAAFAGVYDVISAADGPAALEAMKNEKPDFVFLDIKMPGMSGLEVLVCVKEKGLTSMIWMLTGEEELAVAMKALESGAKGYLTKPFTLESLRNVVSGALDGLDKKEHPKDHSDRPWTVKRNEK